RGARAWARIWPAPPRLTGRSGRSATATEAHRRHTRQLAFVLDAVRASGTEHPSADRIFARVRAVLPTISLGTVYRNLHRLGAEGHIGIVHLGDRLARFHPMPGGHDHFVCEAGGRIWDQAAASA